MDRVRILFCTTLCLAGMAAAGIHSATARAADAPASPWGASSSGSSFRSHAQWFPKMAEAGVATVRLFPEWRAIEPEDGTWQWEAADSLVDTATRNGLKISGLLLGSSPGTEASHAFPMNDLDDWSEYVSAVAGRYREQIRYWEVWNEGNGSFNDGGNTTSDYAKLAIASYEAAKRANAQAQVGLTVASFDLPYLNQTILAMAKAGKPDSFDYLCIHPYEVADGISNDVDGEIPFLWMNHLLRDMLKDSAPERSDAEIWITEVGRWIGTRNERTVSEADAAKALVKLYTMSIAQGIARVQWFEAQAPQGEDQGFGLLEQDGTARDAYQALALLKKALGAKPAYQGWLALGGSGRGYGFVFQGHSYPVLVAWMPKGLTDRSLSFSGDVKVTDPSNGTSRTLKASQVLELSEAPVLVTGLPTELRDQARLNAGKRFPWGGDHADTRTVSIRPGTADADKGVFLLGEGERRRFDFADGSSGIQMEGDIEHPANFYVHPSFASPQTRDYYIRVAVRRLGSGNVGMNLLYEIADSQGRTPYVNRGKWFGASQDSGWQTYTWHVSDASFSKMWGYDFSIRPEQSVPFVLGKVEVSTQPFK